MLTKIKEWRPEECRRRIGDVVEIDGLVYLQVKCSLCTKISGEPAFHYIPINTDLAKMSNVEHKQYTNGE